MENSNQYDEILVRYLFNEETVEEKVFVENWLHASDENQRYFNHLKKAWRLTDIKQDLVYIMDEASLDEKWNRLEQDITEEKVRIIPLNEQKTSEDEYGKEEQPAHKAGVYRLLVAAAVAASVLLVVGLGWKLFFDNKLENSVVQFSRENTDSVLYTMRREVNTTGRDKRIKLADGSLIVLADKSEIVFQEPFTNKRDITLIGKAFFKVAKDKTKPFTVISKDISTTALGTEFTVTAFKNAKQIIVRLYEGKVVIKPIEKGNRKFKNDVYLSPGYEFVYGSQTAINKKAFKVHSDAAPEEIINSEIYHDNPIIPEDAEGSWYMFNNQSLEQVLDQLAGMYNVPIIYEPNDVENIYLTGKYDRSDSLEYILYQIGILHNLKITKKNTGFVISK